MMTLWAEANKVYQHTFVHSRHFYDTTSSPHDSLFNRVVYK